MWWHDPRAHLLLALFLDWLGQLLILALIMFSPDWSPVRFGELNLHDVDVLWLTFCLLVYPLLGWLFGSYTVLRWRRLTLSVLVQRLLITAVLVTLMVVATARWFVNPGVDVWIVTRRVQVVWLTALSVWSLFTRLALRRGLLLPVSPRLLLLASERRQH